MANYYNKDLYKILNLTYEASADDIKTSYRKLVRIYHPDVSQNTQHAEKFKEIQEAYEILINEDSRKKYDILRGFYREKIKKDFEQKSKNKYDTYIKEAKKKSENNEPFTKSINDALDNLFYGKKLNNKQTKPEFPVNGDDINIDLDITYQESINGTNRKVNILHTEPCLQCEGRKFINGTNCPKCSGEGEISVQKKINVKIPAGVVTGSKIRVKKEGNKGINGGKDGDLYLNINVEKNPYYEYNGLDILCNLPITPFEAALGTTISISAPSGKVNVKIPPCTSSGQKLKLSEEGLTNKNKTKKGDIIITVKIIIPNSLSEKEKELYNQLKDSVSTDIRKDFNNAK